jgi:hypothetical protein
MLVTRTFVLFCSELYSGCFLAFQSQEFLFLIKHYLLPQDLEFVANYFYCNWKSLSDIRQSSPLLYVVYLCVYFDFCDVCSMGCHNMHGVRHSTHLFLASTGTIPKKSYVCFVKRCFYIS